MYLKGNMKSEHATAADFSRWEEQAKSMTNSALYYTVKDCFAAARAMQGWNPVKEGYYRDQGCTYHKEYMSRGYKNGK
jgi:hypothetical protein